MEELKVNGEVCFGPLAARKFEGQKDFDKYYIDRTIKQVVKKTGDGEDDFIIVDKVIETKRDISQVINAQACDVGIEAYLKNFELSGEPMPEVSFGDVDDIFKAPVNDFSEMPDNLADAVLLGEKSRKLFASLPKELKGKMNYEEFVSTFTNEMFDAFIEKFTPKKTEEGKNE